MTKSTITRGRLEELAAGQSGFNLRIATHEESQELARMVLAAMDQKPAIHRYRRKAVEPYGHYPWHYEEFVDYPRPVEGIEDEYYYAAPPAVTGFAVDGEPAENHIGSKNALDAIVSFIKSKSNPTVKCYEGVSEQLFKDNCHGIHSHVIEYILKLGEELEDLRAEQDEVQPAKSQTAEFAGWQAKKNGGKWVTIPAEDVDHYRFNEEVPVRVVFTAPQSVIPEGWEPCSPEWIERNGGCSCADAPRIAFAPIGNHYHPHMYYKPQPAPVVPDDLLSMAASAIEDLLEHTDPNTSYYSGVWADVPGKLRAAMLHADNTPVIGIDLASGPDRSVEVRYVAPPGYVMVPKEPTPEILATITEAIRAMRGSAATYARVLAAATQPQNAPQNIPEIIPGWIPVSERLPESNGVYFGWDGKRVLEVYCFFGGFSANQFIHGEITHWMQLPAGPQEVKGE